MHTDTETQQFGDQAHTAVCINVCLFNFISYHCILTTVRQTHTKVTMYKATCHWPMGTSATYTMLIILRDKSRGLLVLRK